MHGVLVIVGLIVVPLLVAAPFGLPALWALGAERNVLGYTLLAPAAACWGIALAALGSAWT